MTKQEMLTELVNLVAEVFEVPAEVVTDEADFFKDLNGGSLEAMQFVTEVEQKYHVSLAEEDAKKIRSIRTAIDMISTYLQLPQH